MTDQKKLFEDWAASYDKFVLENQHSFPFKGYSKLIEEIIKTIEPNSTILDLGIGTGYVALNLQDKLNCKINGIDLSENLDLLFENDP